MYSFESPRVALRALAWLRTLSLFASLALLFAPLALAAPLDTDAPIVESFDQLKAVNQKIISLAKPCSEATVCLTAARGGGSGSGVIVSQDGLILTAGHVLTALGDRAVVIFPDGTRKTAEPLGADFRRDTGMLRINEPGPYPHIKIGDSEALKRNELCVAIGYPGGFDANRRPPLRLGRVQQSGRFLVTDCTVVHGDSGGPLFDLSGKLVGIHSNIGQSLSENRHVPIAVFQDQWEDLEAGKRTGARNRRSSSNGQLNRSRLVLGARLGEPGANGGATVRMVVEGGPLADAGCQAGDIITAVDGKSVIDADELMELLNKRKAGDEVELVYLREGEEQTAKVKLITLGEMMEKMQSRSQGGAGPPSAGPPSAGRAPRSRPPADDSDEESPSEDEVKPEPESSTDKAPGEEEPEDSDPQEPGQQETETQEPQPNDSPEKEKPSAEPPQAEADSAESPGELRDELRESMKNGAPREMSRSDLEKFGGAAEVRRMVRELMQEMYPNGLPNANRRNSQPAPGGDLHYQSMMLALQPALDRAGDCTVEVHVAGEPAALGTVVSSAGWILTKDTETSTGDVRVVRSGKDYSATLLKRFPKHDLALFKIEAQDLEPVQWGPDNEDLALGQIITASTPLDAPLGIGLVSVKERKIRSRVFLGVRLSNHEEGVMIDTAVPNMPAAEAGLKDGDILLAIDGQKVPNMEAMMQKVHSHAVGDTLLVTLKRDNAKLEIEVELGVRPAESQNPRSARVSGKTSERVLGFPPVLQHDIPLDPSLCGGPLLDLQGRCVGINVSRAGRVKTFAIPVDEIRDLLSQFEQGRAETPQTVNAEAPAEEQVEQEPGDEDTQQVRQLIEEVRQRLEEIERRLEKIES